LNDYDLCFSGISLVLFVNRRIKLLKTVDSIVGPLALKLVVNSRLGKRRTSINQKNEKVLVIRPGGIGDAALLLPALKILKDVIPATQIHILCEPRNTGVFAHSPFISKILNYNRLGDLKKVRETEYDCIFDTEQSHLLTGAFVALLKGYKKIGFATEGRERAYDVSVQYYHDEYEAESFFRLFAAGIGNWPENFKLWSPYFSPTNQERAKVDALLADIKKEVVCMFPGASIIERHWPKDRWSNVADELSKYGCQPIIIGGRSEINMSQEIMSAAKSPIVNLCGKLSLSETAAMFDHTRLLISTDSGILHIGTMCNVPTVSLFGPGIADKWGPKGGRHRIINKNLACSPCTKFGTTPPCPNNMACMMEISSKEVLGASKGLL
jgi:ADP-heptose:LPS heptosyltransferase